MRYSDNMDTGTLTVEEERYLRDEQWFDSESRHILEDNATRERLLAEGWCEDCASGWNLFCGCYECDVHSAKRICMAKECKGGPCITEYEL